MIEVNVKEIGVEIRELSNLLEKYNLTYLNLFNSINSLQSSWIGSSSESFFDKIIQDKHETSQMISKLQNQKDIYQYVYDNYKELGNRVKCNLESKYLIITKITNCIDKTNDILRTYQSINTNIDYELKSDIISKIEVTKKVLDKYINILSNVKMIFSKVEEIEQEINKKLENVQILIISDFSER